MIDIHTHILPELDDGSSSVDESTKMLGMLSEQGVDTVVATPHFYIDRIELKDFFRKRSEAVLRLKADIERVENRPLVALGAEVQFYPELASLDGIEGLCIGQTKYLLVEMPFSPWTGYTYQALNKLAARGVVPIAAHIERYLSFLNENEALLKLKEAGALIQINSRFLYERSTKRKAVGMLKKGIVDFVGSDCHNLAGRAPDFGRGMAVVDKKVGRVGFKRLEYWESKLMKDIECF